MCSLPQATQDSPFLAGQGECACGSEVMLIALAPAEAKSHMKPCQVTRALSLEVRGLPRGWTSPVEKTLTGLPGSYQVCKAGSLLTPSHSDFYRHLGGSPLSTGGFASARGRGWADKSPFFTYLMSLFLSHHVWGKGALSSWSELRVPFLGSISDSPWELSPIHYFPTLPKSLGETLIIC